MNKTNLQYLTKTLEINNWKNIPVGFYKGNQGIKQIQGFELFVRTSNINDYLKKSFDECNTKSAIGSKTILTSGGHHSSNCKTTNPYKIRVSEVGSKSPMGVHNVGVTPTMLDTRLPILSDFESYPSLVAARPDKPCILIGYDSEWQNLDDGSRTMISWQFAIIWNCMLVEMCFLRTGNENLTFDIAIGCVLDYLKIKSVDVRTIRRYSYCTGWDGNNNDKPIVVVTDDVNEARNNCKYIYRGSDGEIDGWCHELISDMPDRFNKRSSRDWAWFHTFLDYSVVDSIKICLLCHAGIGDISGFAQSDYILKHLSAVQGGMVSLSSFRLDVRSLKNVNNKYVYPVSLTVCDTMCHAPAKQKSLDNLGKVVGVQKIDVSKEQKKHMLMLLENDPLLFFEYASTDSVFTLIYASALYGYNNTPPVTVTSATARVMRESMMNYLNVNNTDDFNYLYRGLKKVSHGKCKRPDRPAYLESTSLDPINDKANSVQYYASHAYHGGYNSCSEVGYFPFETFDYDLQNAYPTAMCLVPDIDWENPVRMQIQNRKMDIRDFHLFGRFFNPLVPFVCYCRFKFPDNVKFPCIPVNVDGVPVYPLSSDGLNGVYVAGPYIYLALKLGADVFCENGYFLNTLLTLDLQESRSLACAVVQLVKDRNQAKAECGKGSLEELILKTMVCSGYGKNAQNVIQKQSWTAFKDCMEDLGCSAITNPFSAMMTTSIVQCELLAAQNQIYDAGYMSCSVTTDGFISDCPFDTLKSLDLYGFRVYMEQARLFLTDGSNPELWEMKHHQNDLINFTTRGNVSLSPDGVCAHNSAKSGFENDSYDDRLWLMKQVLGRTGTVDCTDDKWASLKDIVQGKTDFRVTKEIRHLHMDFDLKRKPNRNSFTTDYPVVDGVKYKIAHFDTLPYENVEEFRLYRNKKQLCECLRTVAEWDSFFLKVDTNSSGAKVRDLDWSIITSIIMGYRAGMWDIPALANKTVAQKCDWINQHNDSSRTFKISDWKNARRPERQVNMLPMSFLENKLTELQNSK